MTDSNATQPNAANERVPEEQQPKPKDTWDKIEILSRPAFAVMSPILVAIIGYFTQTTLTQLSTQEQNARLYTELLSRREESESLLRKDMFTEVMKGFFSDTMEGDASRELSKRILKMEMLALNFGDSLSLGPLFSELSRDIESLLREDSQGAEDWVDAAGKFQRRLRSLARRVAATQLSTVSQQGQEFAFDVQYSEIRKPAGPEIRDYQPIPLSLINQGDCEKPADVMPSETSEGCMLVLDGVRRRIEIGLRHADDRNQSVGVVIDIFVEVPREVEDERGRKTIENQWELEANRAFTLDFFNFPLTDNTRLNGNQRFAIVLEKFDAAVGDSLTVRGVVFPGLYASHRDKPFLNEAIQELKQQQQRQEQATSSADDMRSSL